MNDAAQRPRLLFLFPGMVMGGAERHGIDLLQRMRKAGYPVGLVAYGHRGTAQMEAICAAEGVVAINAKGMSSLSGWRKTARELRRQNADVIIAVNQTMAVVATVLQRLGLIRGKVVCIFHTTILQPNDQKRFFLFRWIVRIMDVLVYVSETQKRFWEANGLHARRGVAITNGVDFDQFDLATVDQTLSRAALGLGADDYVIGIIAGLRPEKNHEELIEALAILRRSLTSAKVLIVGAGATRPAIEARAKALGVTDEVIFAGEQQDVRPFIRLCDVCVLCSTTETFSLAALEILALGVPMVSSDVGAMGEIVQSGVNGLLYPPGQPDALADRLLTLSEPSVLATMRAAARSSIRHFDIERMVRDYEDLVNALAA